ncbi:hypothetical protein B5X24_HaOG215517 [Helicoverpa armigera]|nr:hypothetical protein B5X24_HaOG215517 [Helicoverpa armigera]
MEDENSIQSKNSIDTVDDSTLTEKHNLSVFIKTWETYPELWNTSCKAYHDTVKKNNALDKLLDIYKKIKPNSTREECCLLLPIVEGTGIAKAFFRTPDRYWPARCSKAGPVNLCGRHPAATVNFTKRGARNTTPPSRGLFLIGRQTPLVCRPQAAPYGGGRSATLRRPPRGDGVPPFFAAGSERLPAASTAAARLRRCVAHAGHSTNVCSAESSLQIPQWWHSGVGTSRLPGRIMNCCFYQMMNNQ